MPVRIARFEPTTMERVDELRRSKAKRAGDPVMEDLLDAVEAGEPQDVLVDSGSTAKGMRIAIGRAAGKRGLAVETFESRDGAGNTTVTVARKAEIPTRQKAGQAQPPSDGRKRGRPRKQEQDEVEIALQESLASQES